MDVLNKGQTNRLTCDGDDPFEGVLRTHDYLRFVLPQILVTCNFQLPPPLPSQPAPSACYLYPAT